MENVHPETRHHLQGMVAVKIRLPAPDALQDLGWMRDSPAYPLAKVRAQVAELGVGLVGGQRAGDRETAAVQGLRQAVGALGQLAWVAQLHRDEDQVAG